MTCDEAQQYIAYYVSEAYDDIPDVEELEYHLAECEHCSHEYKKYLELTLDIAEHADLLDPQKGQSDAPLESVAQELVGPVIITIVADGVKYELEWDGSEISKSVPAQHELKVMHGDEVLLEVDKTELAFARLQHLQQNEFDNFIVKIQLGHFQDAIVIENRH